MNYHSKLAGRASRTAPSPIAESLDLLSKQQGIISFAAGTPDSTMLPTELLSELTDRAIARHDTSVLQYGHMQGLASLRESFAGRLGVHRQMSCSADDIIITTGASGAISSLCTAFLNPGDTVLVENPTYTLAIEAFATFEARIEAVESDNYGILPDALEARLQAGGVKFIYLLPTFQNPTGRTIPTARRQAIGRLAQTYDVLVIEDDIYSDLRYTGTAEPSVHSFAPHHTFYIASASKVFAPAARIGAMVLPPEVMRTVTILKPSLDLQASTLTQALMDEFIREGHIETHLEKVTQHYSRKRDTLLAALKAHIPKGFTWNEPEGGMFLWITGPQDFNADELLPKAIDNGVAYIPGSAFFVEPNKHRNYIRLNFATPPQEQIEQGIRLLSRLL